MNCFARAAQTFHVLSEAGKFVRNGEPRKRTLNTCTRLEFFTATNCSYLFCRAEKLVILEETGRGFFFIIYFFKQHSKGLSGRYAAQCTLLVLTARASHSCTYSIPQIGPSLFITCCFQQSFTLSLPRHANVKQATVM